MYGKWDGSIEVGCTGCKIHINYMYCLDFFPSPMPSTTTTQYGICKIEAFLPCSNGNWLWIKPHRCMDAEVCRKNCQYEPTNARKNDTWCLFVIEMWICISLALTSNNSVYCHMSVKSRISERIFCNAHQGNRPHCRVIVLEPKMC